MRGGPNEIFANPQTIKDVRRWAVNNPDSLVKAFVNAEETDYAPCGEEVKNPSGAVIEPISYTTVKPIGESISRATVAAYQEAPLIPVDSLPPQWVDSYENFRKRYEVQWKESVKSEAKVSAIPLQELNPPIQLASQKKPQEQSIPNKVASGDPKWGNKVAWSSKQLMERQKELETYSAEVAMLMEAVRVVAERTSGRTVNSGELEFVANFGSPIVNNTQQISILLSKPVELRIQLHRELFEGKLKWSADVGYGERTPLIAAARLNDMQRAGGAIPMDPITVTRGEVEAAEEAAREERRRRKVRL
jgi:hypothetical protein